MTKLYLTAGHNGPGTGASGFIDEGAETIALRDDIVKAIAGRIQVVTDRNTDKLPIVLQWLTRLVSPKDLLVELHFNASANAQGNGTETIVPEKCTSVEQKIALKLNALIVDTIGTNNRGIKTESQTAHGTLGILRQPNCNNILIEVCFVSNKQDALLYRIGRDKLVQKLANAFVEIVTGL